MTARERNTPALLAFVVGALVGGAGMAIAFGRHAGPAHAPVEASVLPTDPAAYVPAGAHGVIVADVDRLRAAHVLAGWFGAAAAGEPCEAALLRRVRRIAVAIGGSFDEIGVAFAGDLPRDELIACARTRVSPGSSLERGSYRGVELTRIAPRRTPDLLPPASVSEIVYLRGGIVLAGSMEMVRRMIDRGLSSSRDDAPTVVSELQRRIGPGFDAVGVMQIAPGAGPAGEDALDPALVHVHGVAIGLHATDTLEFTSLLACDDYDSPRLVADAATRLREGLSSQLRLPALAEPLRRAQIERHATDVRVTTSLHADELDALALMVRSLLSSPSPPSAPQPP